MLQERCKAAVSGPLCSCPKALSRFAVSVSGLFRAIAKRGRVAYQESARVSALFCQLLRNGQFSRLGPNKIDPREHNDLLNCW
jgi:hypothetical protein